MKNFTKQLLSGSTNGKQIAVAATAIGSGTTIHTAATGTGGFDEVWLYATNIDTSDRVLTLGWGGTATADTMLITIPFNSGRYLVADGKLLQNGLIVKASADSANKINLDGFVNRISD